MICSVYTVYRYSIVDVIDDVYIGIGIGHSSHLHPCPECSLKKLADPPIDRCLPKKSPHNLNFGTFSIV